MQISKWVTLGVGMVCLMIVAAVLNAQHLYYMAAILLTLPAVSYGLGWYALRGLSFSRELNQTAWTGEEGSLVYTVHNATSVARFFLSIHEPLPTWIEPLDPEPPLFNVTSNRNGRSPTVVSIRIRYHKRGVYPLRYFDVTAIDPLGVFAFTRRIPCEGELVVFPLPRPVRSLILSGSERDGWQEFTAAALRGGSVDPDGVREYVPGDPLRRIHWRQTARTGKLAVIEFEERRNHSGGRGRSGSFPGPGGNSDRRGRAPADTRRFDPARGRCPVIDSGWRPGTRAGASAAHTGCPGSGRSRLGALRQPIGDRKAGLSATRNNASGHHIAT